MGIPLGWNVVRDEAKEKAKAKEKDVLRADVSGRSSIRRRQTRARNGGAFDGRGLPALTPGFAAALDGAALDGAALDDGRRLPALTPGFAPAHRRRDADIIAADIIAHPPDGLGDRNRSNSVSSTSSNLPWHSFLTTVVPDPVPPTAESSFASAAASASFTASSSRASSSNSNSAASARTHLTVPDVTDSSARACDSDDDAQDTADDTDDDAAAHPLSRRRMRPSYFADAPPTPTPHGRSVMDTATDATRYVRILYSHDLDLLREQQADSFATLDDQAPHTGPASPLDQELRDARSLLERLTRRGDIGDDFWASVGLTRSFTDGIERVQERAHLPY